MSITLSTEGRRVYVVGNTYPIKDQLRSLGCKWDRDSKRWWAGTTKREDLEALVAKPAASSEPTGEDLRVVGRAAYKGKTYYVVWHGRTKSGDLGTKLAFRDGSSVFWAAKGEPIKILADYDEPRSIRSLREFAAARKDAGPAPSEDCYLRGGQWLVKGCGQCAALGRMCKQCEFDEYDM